LGFFSHFEISTEMVVFQYIFFYNLKKARNKKKNIVKKWLLYFEKKLCKKEKYLAKKKRTLSLFQNFVILQII